MNPFQLFFFRLYLSISDAITRSYEWIEEGVRNMLNKCLRKTICHDDSLEVLNINEMKSKRLFVQSE